MEYGPAEMMVVALAREVQNGKKYFTGLASPVPVTAMKLARALHAPSCTWITIAGGIDPQPEPAITPSTLDQERLLKGVVSYFSLEEVFDLACSGRLDYAFLSFIQLSRKGEINMSYVGGEYEKPKVRLPGGAGSATLTPTVKQVLIWRTAHDPRSLVEKVDFCTTKGNVYKVITPLCTFVMRNGELEVESVHPYTTLEEVRKNTGWEITQTEAPVTPPPTDAELAALAKVDPNKIYLAEF
ncbi:MAG: CoA-transferase [Firmicutes bacterium]|nr:CoA-transferase [Bacillota bacterium]